MNTSSNIQPGPCQNCSQCQRTFQPAQISTLAQLTDNRLHSCIPRPLEDSDARILFRDEGTHEIRSALDNHNNSRKNEDSSHQNLLQLSRLYVKSSLSQGCGSGLIVSDFIFITSFKSKNKKLLIFKRMSAMIS